MECLSDYVLTVGNAVMFDGGFMHPETFKGIFGLDAWNELLAKPRVLTDYDCGVVE